MYTKWLPFLNNKNIILASGSPRRKEILSDLGIKFTVKTSDFPENLSKENTTPSNYVEQTCLNKFNFFLEKRIPITTDFSIRILFNIMILSRKKFIFNKNKYNNMCSYK